MSTYFLYERMFVFVLIHLHLRVNWLSVIWVCLSFTLPILYGIECANCLASWSFSFWFRWSKALRNYDATSIIAMKWVCLRFRHSHSLTRRVVRHDAQHTHTHSLSLHSCSFSVVEFLLVNYFWFLWSVKYS